MESLDIFEESLKELNRLGKQTAMDSMSINLSKLDRQTKQQMINAINNVIATRRTAINNVILGVH